VRYQVLKAASMKMIAFWDITPCSRQSLFFPISSLVDQLIFLLWHHFFAYLGNESSYISSVYDIYYIISVTKII
jgi:hypothetical protein